MARRCGNSHGKRRCSRALLKQRRREGGQVPRGLHLGFLAFDLRSGGWRWNDAPDNLAQAYGFARGYIMERSQLTQVPEPAAISLLGVGLLAAAFARRKRA